MAILNAYNYNVELSLLLEDEIINLDQTDINSIIIDSDYDKNTMPIIIVGVNIEPNTYNKFVLNSDTAFVSAKIYKSDVNAVSASNSVYISDRFAYKMTDNPNYNESLINMSSSEEYINNATFRGYIALINLESIDSNKRLFNTIIKKTDLLSAVVNFISHLNLCIEPFDDNPSIDQFIIPPIASITNLLNYMNQQFCFYNSGYRYFRDFNITYLLSCSGKAVPTTDDDYATVIIDIVDPSSYSGYDDGIEIDDKSKAYIIHVPANATSIDKDKYIDNSFNSIIGVDSKGNTDKVVLDIPRNPESTEKVYLERVNNIKYINNTKQALESKSLIVTVTKANVDSSILTPNKEYIIKNYKDNSDYDGKFILSYKKEVMILASQGFQSNIVFGLRKINEDDL